MSGTVTGRDAWIQGRVETLTGRRLATPPVVFADTSDFMAIDRDAIVNLQGELFLVTGTEREGRFGLEGEPKFWVKRAVALGAGSARNRPTRRSSPISASASTGRGTTARSRSTPTSSTRTGRARTSRASC